MSDNPKRRNLPSKDRICDWWDDDPRMANRSMMNDACWLCGAITTLQRCHILPRCEGGADTADNLHLLCSGCHKRTEHLSGDAYWAVFDVIKQDIVGKAVGAFLVNVQHMIDAYDDLTDLQKDVLDTFRTNPEMAEEIRRRAVF